MLLFCKNFFIGVLIFISTSFSLDAYYKLETGSKKMVKAYHISQKNLGTALSRKEFITILYKLYVVYKKERGVIIDYSDYKKIDNKKYFVDVDLSSSFGKKLNYFADIGAFSKNQKFTPHGKISQKDFFTIMRRLKIIHSLQGCKALRICEKELDSKFGFTKGTYLKYWSKILDKKLRKYFSAPEQYINSGYKPLLSPGYRFPILGQTLNGCYAFSIRNIMKYHHGIGMRISTMEKYMKKPGEKLWNSGLMNVFDKLAHVKRKKFNNIDTIINSLQVGDPLAITYYLKYYSYSEKKYKKVLHIVSAYSFDRKGVWVSETVSGRRLRVSWKDIFNIYGRTRNNRIFRYEYQPKYTWSKKELALEKKYNFLVGEY